MVGGYLQINQYYRLAWRNGTGANWTDAIFDLSARVSQLKPSRVMAVDWGVLDSLRLTQHGRQPLGLVFDLVPAGAPPSLGRVAQAAGMEGAVFVGHTPKYEFFRGSGARLAAAAEQVGFTRQMISVETDSSGRPMLEVYRFVRK
jgi:hypothetical protein